MPQAMLLVVISCYEVSYNNFPIWNLLCQGIFIRACPTVFEQSRPSHLFSAYQSANSLTDVKYIQQMHILLDILQSYNDDDLILM